MTALLVTACNQDQAITEDFSSEAGQFSISTPAPLEETQQSVDTPVGPIEIYTFTAEQDDAAYVVAYSDYPPEIVEQTDPDQLLDSSRDGAINNLGGTLVSEEAIDLEGNPGRSLVISTDVNAGEPAVIDSRIYLVENRLYQILVVMPEDDNDDAASTNFLESFSLN
ncbi:hypothetical protein PN498_00745 [Oscillatoria sp. CS-180]|uniref:hypothetical protein n=1 Tax=Oscillatoria sp. CS-180 TaxID=3021720 RepID=UPI00232EBCAD|nr:hypothetical protein [Oscillatoria sp. CS-180]MDB9524500.1 hypothetical protein [Oscillatoria sp. CS-180]